MTKYLVDHDHDSYREEVTANSAAKAARKVMEQEYGTNATLARSLHTVKAPEWFYVYELDSWEPSEVYIVMEVTDADDR